MSKKSIRQKNPSRANRKRFGINVVKIAEFFSLLSATIAGLWQRLWLMARRVTGKAKEDAIGLPGPAYVLGSAPTSASDIAASYDKSEYPNIHTGPTSGVTPLDKSVWPIWTDAAGDTDSNNPLVASQTEVDGKTNRGTIDDYWVSYDGDTPDLDSNDE